MIEGSTHRDNIAILNLCGWNNMASKCIKQTLTELQRGADKLITIVGNLVYLLSLTDRTDTNH